MIRVLKNALPLIAVAIMLAACGAPSVPSTFEKSDKSVAVYPDYKDVTVPCNIAPLVYAIQESVLQYSYHIILDLVLS